MSKIKKKMLKELKEYRSRWFRYIVRDNMWSFIGNQYHDPLLGDSMGRELDRIILDQELDKYEKTYQEKENIDS